MIEKIKKFVIDNTLDRDNSHGYIHMLNVYNNSMKILSNINELSEDILRWVTIVSLLHDVADHKYDKDGNLSKKVKDFLYSYDYHNTENLWKCIECISFSKEKLLGKRYYEKLLPPNFCIVRDIVSDADKLEALGLIGLERCEIYIKHKSKENLKDHDIVKKILLHCEEKLFLLKDYMRTEYGYTKAIHLEKEMKAYLHTRLNQ